MYESTAPVYPPLQTIPHLRVIRSEEPPEYDAQPRDTKAHQAGYAMIPAEVFALCNADAIAVYAVIDKHADRTTGECWPGIETICKTVGRSKPTVIKTIRLLEEAGVITCEKQTKFGGMNARTNYTVTAYVRRSTEFTGRSNGFTQAVKPVYSGGKAALPEHTSVEQEPVEQEITPLPPTEKRPKKPLPDTAPSQAMVKLWCELAKVDQPANYGKALGVAKRILDAGVTLEQFPDLYGFVSKWAVGADLGLLERQIDRWRASLNAPKPAERPYWQWTEAQITEELQRCFRESQEPHPDLLKAAQKFPPQEGRYRNPWASFGGGE